MFAYQTFLTYKLENILYIGETKKNSSEREGYGETFYPDGKIERGIYINDMLALEKNN